MLFLRALRRMDLSSIAFHSAEGKLGNRFHASFVVEFVMLHSYLLRRTRAGQQNHQSILFQLTAAGLSRLRPQG